MARGDQLPVPGMGSDAQSRVDATSAALNDAVALVMDLEVKLRQARADERRARAAEASARRVLAATR